MEIYYILEWNTSQTFGSEKSRGRRVELQNRPGQNKGLTSIRGIPKPLSQWDILVDLQKLYP